MRCCFRWLHHAKLFSRILDATPKTISTPCLHVCIYVYRYQTDSSFSPPFCLVYYFVLIEILLSIATCNMFSWSLRFLYAAVKIVLLAESHVCLCIESFAYTDAQITKINILFRKYSISSGLFRCKANKYDELRENKKRKSIEQRKESLLQVFRIYNSFIFIFCVVASCGHRSINRQTARKYIYGLIYFYFSPFLPFSSAEARKKEKDS